MLYAKAMGPKEVWHICKTGLDGSNHCVTVLCGYPEMPEFPRHSGRFQPHAMLGTNMKPVDPVCEKCIEIDAIPNDETTVH